MNDRTGDRWRWFRAWPRQAGVLAVGAGIVLLAAACSSGSSASAGSPSNPGSSSSTGGSSAAQQELAYAQCMRSHGVPNYPDPNPNPTVNPRIALAQAGVDTNSPQFQAASQICERLYPLPSRGASRGGGS
jgi:hypothetical protein